MSMTKFVTVEKRCAVGLLDPTKTSTPEKATTMTFVNKSREESLEHKLQSTRYVFDKYINVFSSYLCV